MRAATGQEPTGWVRRPNGMNATSRGAIGVLLVLVIGVLALAACGSASVDGGPGSSAPGSSSSSPGSPAATGLRGTKVQTIACNTHIWQPDAGAARLLSGTPVRMVICPQLTEASGPPTDLRPVPQALLRALSLPDAPKPTGQLACPAYADVPRLVYAQMSDGALFLLHIPVDACSHYLRAAVSVVDRYAHDGSLVS